MKQETAYLLGQNKGEVYILHYTKCFCLVQKLARISLISPIWKFLESTIWAKTALFPTEELLAVFWDFFSEAISVSESW